MDNAAMTEPDKKKIWDAIGKCWIVGEIFTPDHSKRKDNAVMYKIRPTFESLYEDAQDGTLAADEDFPRKFWGIRSTDTEDKTLHPGQTLAHVAALAGRLPNWVEDTSAIWDWKAYDGWSVRDAWKEGNAPSIFTQAGAI
jgi:hypothetical protein